ncbi:hypothetical protein ROZALSC1DRAFT_21026 [Rozella allomycis CSF55]|uniref:Uncharacterized protein n=1 Tax=Rozella allomycis (strain CSF55) TaxID=988480 RepID=A0A4P9YNM6_ROZAC|nr:hypothetical protein ROZALSC1DRAFT_21026 [Rozella allomycis CSF55]
MLWQLFLLGILRKVEGHSWLISPEPKLTVDTGMRMMPNKCNGNPTPSSLGITWPGPAAGNANGLVEWMQSKNTSLKDLVDGPFQCDKCGTTDPSHVVANPSGSVQIGGLIHVGPCEAWLGDTKVYTAPTQCPSSFNVDFTKCGGNCLLRVILAATHLNSPEFFQYCVTVGGGKIGQSYSNADKSSVAGSNLSTAPIENKNVQITQSVITNSKMNSPAQNLNNCRKVRRCKKRKNQTLVGHY